MRKHIFLVLILVLTLCATMLVDFLRPTYQVMAADSIITIDPVPTVNAYDETLNFFTITATVTSAQFNGQDVEWLLGEEKISDLKITTPSSSPNISILKMYRIEYSSVSALDVWVFTARIKTAHEVSTEVAVTFKTSPSPLSIVPLSSIKQQYSANELSPFVMSVSGLEEEQSIQWYMLQNTNKFVKAPGVSTQRTFSYTPTSAGEFIFKAKVGGEVSQSFKVSVDYVPITQIDFSVSMQTENRNGFNTYLFRITNLNASNDVANINWFIEGYSSPIQYGGTNFLFQPTAYGTYRIVARYGTVKSTTHTIEVKIDRTLEILIGSGILVGIMAIGLVIIIIKNIKSEKIW